MKMQHPSNPAVIVDAGDRADAYTTQGWKPLDEETAEQVSVEMTPCPTCGAVGDEPCRTAAGNEASEPHAGRG